MRNVRDKKRELRARSKKLRAGCPPQLKAELDKKLSQKFLSLPEYKECKVLFIFVSSPIECETSAIISRALSDGKKVAVPKCRERSGYMDFYFITSFSQLSPGKFSIPEPDPELCEQATDFSSGLCVVPGLCFDYMGYRVGFGKGYYDRFLNIFKGTSAGICYSRFVEKELPRGAYDKKTDILVTEKYIIRTAA